MLKLHDQWRSYPAGSVAADLVSQVADASLQTDVWRHLLRAALDRMVEGWGTTKGVFVRVEERPRLTWRINEGVFVYLPEIAYDSLQRCLDLAPVAPFLTILTPPRRETLLHNVFAALLGDRVPIVTAADTYLSLRDVFAQADLHCGRDESLIDLLNRYNKRTVEARLDDFLLVEMPPRDA
jgi:hypothetical protein